MGRERLPGRGRLQDPLQPDRFAARQVFQKLFFWGTAGAALGGTIDGFPGIVDASTASTGLIVGASAGGATGAALSASGQSRYERAWAACVRARGYALDAEARPSTQRQLDR